MQIVKLSIQNFQSYGNIPTEIDFTDQSRLVLITGENGNGKSTILKALSFVLYGKVDGVTLKDIPNRINKNCLVTVDLYCNSQKVHIERGLAPDIFSVIVDENEIDTAGKANIQQYLETELFRIPYSMYKNIISISINDFKSFITMTPGDKREIIDRLFGLSIINDVSVILKDNKKKLNYNKDMLDKEMSGITTSIETIQKKINLIDEKLSTDDVDIDNTKHIIEVNTNTLDKIKSALKIIDEEGKKNTGIITEQNKIIGSCETGIKSIEASLKKFEAHVCPLCGAEITEEFHQHKVEESRISLNEYVSKRDSAVAKQQEMTTANQELMKKKQQLLDKQSELQTSIYQLNNKLNNSKEILLHEKESLLDTINQFDSNMKEKHKEIMLIDKKNDMNNILMDIFSDTGLKRFIFSNTLPMINATVASMLDKMNLNYQIVFDEDFNAKINYMNNEINYKSLSTGERKKVDFAVVLALLHTIKIKFPDINILFLDEVFSSIDQNGIYEMTTILRDISDTYNLNTFVINHVAPEEAQFDNVFVVTKDSGFSTITMQ